MLVYWVLIFFNFVHLWRSLRGSGRIWSVAVTETIDLYSVSLCRCGLWWRKAPGHIVRAKLCFLSWPSCVNRVNFLQSFFVKLFPLKSRGAQGVCCPSFGLVSESDVLLQCVGSWEVSLSELPKSPGTGSLWGTSSLNLPWLIYPLFSLFLPRRKRRSN